MSKTITLSIAEIEQLLEAAKSVHDSDYIHAVELTVNDEAKYHGASDQIDARILSGYAECYSKWIYSNKRK